MALAQMQWLGECPDPWEINTELKTLAGNTPPGGPWFRFLHYNASLDPDTNEPSENAGVKNDLRRLQQMDSAKIIDDLYQLGCAEAEKRFTPSTFSVLRYPPEGARRRRPHVADDHRNCHTRVICRPQKACISLPGACRCIKNCSLSR